MNPEKIMINFLFNFVVFNDYYTSENIDGYFGSGIDVYWRLQHFCENLYYTLCVDPNKKI